MDNEQSF
jgi:hypothetical protein